MSGKIKNFIVIGAGGGREAALAVSARKSGLNCFAVAPHKNPSLVEACSEENIVLGKPHEKDVLSKIVDLIRKDDPKLEQSAFWCASDEVLAKGAVNILRGLGVKDSLIIGPEKEAARIESDKVYSMKLMSECFPQYTPANWIIADEKSLTAAFEEIKQNNIQIVVKPLGLTAGKGVKVMGKHLADYNQAAEYSLNLLKNDGSVLLVERIDGVEFTVMAITDGDNTIFVPSCFDYPYRHDGETGPGTGGMGSFSAPALNLPFIEMADFKTCTAIIEGILKKLKFEGLKFNGVLYGGFFVTKTGIKFIEFNARFGDPECINVMEVMESNFSDLLEGITTRTLSEANCSFKKQASVVKYLVPPMYAIGPADPVEFELDVAGVRKAGAQVYFSACEKIAAENSYRTLGTSRTAAICAVAATIEEATEIVNAAINNCHKGSLEHRMDVGKYAALSADTVAKL